MATWASTTFTTLQKLTEFEAEINNLAGTYNRPCVTMAAAGRIIVSPNTLTALYAIFSDGTTELMTLSTTYWKIGSTANTAIGYFDGVTGYQFPALQGSGVITCNNSTISTTLALSTGSTWSTYDAQNSWQSKITLAKSIMGSDIKKRLAEKGYRDSDMTTGTVTLDYFEDLAVFELASNYLSLYLCYNDLSGMTVNNEFDDPAKSKANFYKGLYDDEIINAMFYSEWGTSSDYVPITNYTGVRQEV
jgi:hypothetical protein